MKVLFCKISYMKYYRGASVNDQAYNGGKFVVENGYGHEEYNFQPMEIEGYKEEVCRGFVETKYNPAADRFNDLHFEKIPGCDLMKKEYKLEDVLVIWCATRQQNDMTVVGWYEHATVYRRYEEWILVDRNGGESERYFNVEANAHNCVLLPEGERNRNCWAVHSAKKTGSFGFGQSLVWYASEPQAKAYVEKLLNSIKEYKGENWIYLSEEEI